MAGPDRLHFPQHAADITSSKTSPPRSQIAKKTSVSPQAQDNVDLSPENTEYAKLLKRIDNVPDIRHERVEQIRKSLEAGTYNIDSHLVAKRIIQEIAREGTPALTQPDVPDTSKSS